MNGKVAIVTGGASGIGRATCELLAKKGARVVVADVDEARGQAVAAGIGEAAAFFRLDVGEETDWEAAVDFAKDRFGGFGILVNNAGIQSPRLLDDVDAQDWMRVHRVNALGPFLGCKHAVRAMRHTGGAIVNISSTAATAGAATLPAYASSKGAVRSLTLSVAAHCVKNDLPIRCNTVLPGGTRTQMMRDVLLERMGVDIDEDTVEAREILEGVAHPSLLADAIVFLCSDDAARVQGTELVVDGMIGRVGAW